MKVNVLFWGSLTEMLEEKQFPVEDVETLHDLKRELHTRIPRLEGFPYIIAVNHEVVKDNIILKDGDEVAFMPPYAGG